MKFEVQWIPCGYWGWGTDSGFYLGVVDDFGDLVPVALIQEESGV